MTWFSITSTDTNRTSKLSATKTDASRRTVRRFWQYSHDSSNVLGTVQTNQCFERPSMSMWIIFFCRRRRADIYVLHGKFMVCVVTIESVCKSLDRPTQRTIYVRRPDRTTGFSFVPQASQPNGFEIYLGVVCFVHLSNVEFRCL